MVDSKTIIVGLAAAAAAAVGLGIIGRDGSTDRPTGGGSSSTPSFVVLPGAGGTTQPDTGLDNDDPVPGSEPADGAPSDGYTPGDGSDGVADVGYPDWLPDSINRARFRDPNAFD